jgi:hypothetical protein
MLRDGPGWDLKHPTAISGSVVPTRRSCLPAFDCAEEPNATQAEYDHLAPLGWICTVHREVRPANEGCRPSWRHLRLCSHETIFPAGRSDTETTSTEAHQQMSHGDRHAR